MKQESRVRKMADAAGVEMQEVRARTQRLITSTDDPKREKRVRELAARVAAGAYRVDGAEIVEAALDGDERVLGRRDDQEEPPEILRD